jgi:hypothetical protein
MVKAVQVIPKQECQYSAANSICGSGSIRTARTNAHYMDESERAGHGVFCDADGAIAACKEIVDDELNTMWKPGTTAKELYELYVAFGPDPFVMSLNPNDPGAEFSAWTYAKKRCKDLVRSGG